MVAIKYQPARNRVALLCAMLTISVSIAGPAAAQGSTAIEEITVTAQKREQSLQEVPIAITAFTGQAQRDLRWDSPIDMISQVPNLVGQSLIGTTQPTFYIRGIGTSDLHHSAQSPVGVYVDEVYFNSTIAQGFQLFDLERIEVLRGPQGTLWGKNTTGGAMHFVSAKPSHESSGYAEFSYGFYNGDAPEVRLGGALNGSLVDDVLAARVALQVHSRDGWVKNEFLDKDIEELNRYSGRLSLLYTPSDNTQAVLRIASGRQRGDHVVLHHQLNDNPDAFTVLPYTENSARDIVSQDRDAPEDVNFSSFSLQLDFDGDFGTFTSITGYMDVERDEDADADASPFNAGGGPFRNNTEQFTQEFRFTSLQEKSFRWIGGLYYFDETLNGSTTIVDGPDGFGPFCPPTDICGAQNFEDRDRESFAAYLSADFDISERTTLSGGLRWTEDEERLGIGLIYYSAHPNSAFDGREASIWPGTLFVASDQDSNVLNESWSEVTGDVTLAFSLSDEVNLYGKVSRGYLAGTHVIPFAFLSEVNTLEPEEIDAFEVGVKSRLLDGRMELNAAAFLYDYANIQVARVDPANAGQGQRRENAADADVSGLEVEMRFQATDNLYIGGGIGYTDATYQEFLSFNSGTNMVDDFSGNQTLNTPEWNANAMLVYSNPMESGTFEFQTDWNYQDELYFAPDNNSTEIGESRTIGNLALRYVAPDDKWRASLFVNNVTDEENIVNVRDFSAFWGLNLVILGPPRVYGVAFDYNF